MERGGICLVVHGGWLMLDRMAFGRIRFGLCMFLRERTSFFSSVFHTKYTYQQRTG